jgi:hypothetical protein
LVAVSPAIERAVDVVVAGVELVRATAARALDAEREESAAFAPDAIAAGRVEVKPAKRRVHMAGAVLPLLPPAPRGLPQPEPNEPGAARGPPQV